MGAAPPRSPRPCTRSMTPVRASANAVSKMRNVCRTGSLRMVGVLVLMYVALTLALALPGPLSSQNSRGMSKGGSNPRSATWLVASPHASRTACTMQVVAAPARASARPSVRHSVPLPAPPPSTAHRLSSPKDSWKKADQPPAQQRVWVQVVRGDKTVGRAAGVFMANSSLVDDVLRQVWSQYRSLAEFPSLLYASTNSDPKNETAKLSSEDTVKDALNKKAGCTSVSPLYVHAPVRRPAAPAPLRPLRPLPLAVLLSPRPFCSAVPRTRSRRTHVSGSARAIP